MERKKIRRSGADTAKYVEHEVEGNVHNYFVNILTTHEKWEESVAIQSRNYLDVGENTGKNNWDLKWLWTTWSLSITNRIFGMTLTTQIIIARQYKQTIEWKQSTKPGLTRWKGWSIGEWANEYVLTAKTNPNQNLS